MARASVAVGRAMTSHSGGSVCSALAAPCCSSSDTVATAESSHPAAVPVPAQYRSSSRRCVFAQRLQDC